MQVFFFSKKLCGRKAQILIAVDSLVCVHDLGRYHLSKGRSVIDPNRGRSGAARGHLRLVCPVINPSLHVSHVECVCVDDGVSSPPLASLSCPSCWTKRPTSKNSTESWSELCVL